MSAATATADAQAPAKPKSKKLLFILIGVIVLALAAAGGTFFLMKKNAADEEDADGTEVVEKHDDKSTPPTYLPMDNMVVNLADAGGARFVQLGITLQLQDVKTSEDVKAYMPSIRSSLLVLISQLTAEEILQVTGKEKLAKDIIAVIAQQMGYEVDAPAAEDTQGKKRRHKAPPNPVQAVLFSSFIVQ
ncbi:MAG: flagellar basal body-associated FliL family protein [Hydrogenophaga sp.]|uniref:flagellar basal body-associated FliL family protein n=1 Tax=Hydrogenophaga sp. TaxID=1904254 RepID=UPI0025BF7157|nr:flagellar basal body-associated FliL family protein [Hydrogenophaga sp.]MBT9551841.1 flagellar basal body-associated FliL family protein [Hydrogenophaga sp.]